VKRRIAKKSTRPAHEPHRCQELRRLDPHHRDIGEAVVYPDASDDYEELFGPYWEDEPPESLKGVKQQKTAGRRHRGAWYVPAALQQPQISLRDLDLRGQIRTMSNMLQQAVNLADRRDFESARQVLENACASCDLLSSAVRRPSRF